MPKHRYRASGPETDRSCDTGTLLGEGVGALVLGLIY